MLHGLRTVSLVLQGAEGDGAPLGVRASISVWQVCCCHSMSPRYHHDHYTSGLHRYKFVFYRLLSWHRPW